MIQKKVIRTAILNRELHLKTFPTIGFALNAEQIRTLLNRKNKNAKEVMNQSATLTGKNLIPVLDIITGQ
jgi:hypothetical protein